MHKFTTITKEQRSWSDKVATGWATCWSPQRWTAKDSQCPAWDLGRRWWRRRCRRSHHVVMRRMIIQDVVAGGDAVAVAAVAFPREGVHDQAWPRPRFRCGRRRAETKSSAPHHIIGFNSSSTTSSSSSLVSFQEHPTAHAFWKATIYFVVNKWWGLQISTTFVTFLIRLTED